MLDIVVIGSGPAGVSAAVYLKRFNFNVAVINKGETALKTAHQIDNYYGFYGISGSDLYDKGINQLKELDIPVIDETVLSIEAYDKFVITTDKGIYEARKVILATGKSRNKLKVKNAKDYELKGLSYCATCDGFFYRNKKIGIIGSGSAMLHELSFLKSMSPFITVFTDGEDLVLEGVEVVKEKVISLYGEEFLEGVKTSDGEYSIDGLFVAIGDASTFDFIKHMGIETDDKNNIIVNNNYQTNIKNLYAIGDAIGGVLQITKASYDGMMVAYSINSERKNDKWEG